MKRFALLKFNWRDINIPLLLFLILFLNVKFVIKVAAILLLMLYAKNLKLGLSWKNSRLPLFYGLIAGIETLKYLVLTRDFSLSYIFVFGMGLLQWIIALLAIHHIKLFIEKDPVEKTHTTIKAFFLLNFLVSLFFLLVLLIKPEWLSVWGHVENVSFSSPSAGDTILGISFDSSIVNATINSLGLIYFLYKRDYLFSFLCIIVISVCTSNVTFVFIVATIGLMFFTVIQKKVRLAVFLNGLILLASYIMISPANREYIRNYVVQMYVLNKNPEVIATTPPDTSTHINTGVVFTDTAINKLPAKPVQGKLSDTVYTFNNKKLEKAIDHLVTIKTKKDSTGIPQLQLTEVDFKSRPGKLISFFQTYNYMTSGSKEFLFGAGVGNFSSKLAFRAAGVKTLGSYPEKFAHTTPEFEMNHLKTFLFYLNSDASQHSVLNYPNSVYNQLLGEYGFIGALLFAIFYLGYFIKRFRLLSYGRYLLFILLAFFFMEYWFEMYSLVILFELMMLLNIKEKMELQKNIQNDQPQN